MARARVWAALTVTAALVAGCGPDGEYVGLNLQNFDPDLRGFGGGMSTSQAAASAAPRPQPDQRGVISYPGYQVAIARQGDTVATIASRLGLNAAQVASHNAIAPNVTLNAGAVVALPTRVAAAGGGGGAVTDPFAGRSGQAGTQAGQQPQQHVVAAGETAWSVARRYNVAINDLARWNGLGSDMAVRPGQRLLIPVSGAAAPNATQVVTRPGAGSPTPQPPSAAGALPDEQTTPASAPVAAPSGPNLGNTRTAASGSGRFQMPVNGSIARAYAPGRNEGIDISAAPGAPVSAAGAGTVAAITRDVGQVPIIVIRHEGNLMTVYAGLDDVSVTKGQSVQAGTPLGKARNEGLVHFEVRNGFESVDPERYLN